MTSFKSWDNIVHKSNIKDILETFENKGDIQKLTERFKLKNEKQTEGLYLYLKYLGEEFVPMSDVEGKMEMAGLSSFFSEYLKLYFT